MKGGDKFNSVIILIERYCNVFPSISTLKGVSGSREGQLKKKGH